MNPYEQRGWIPVAELESAVAAKLLTQDEARLIVWSYFPELSRNAATAPPEIGSNAS